jgi:hypothetical protein
MAVEGYCDYLRNISQNQKDKALQRQKSVNLAKTGPKALKKSGVADEIKIDE